MAEPRRKPREDISTPTISEPVTLRTHQAQQVKKRVLDKVLTSMFLTDVILRLIADDGEADIVNDTIAGTIGRVDADLTAEIARLTKIRDDNGITSEVGYSRIEQTTVGISSPMGGRFIVVLRRLDAMMAMVDLLWMCGHLNGAQKKRAGYEWSRRILRAANSVIMLERRARREAVRKGKGTELLEVAGDGVTETIMEDAEEGESAGAYLPGRAAAAAER